MIQLYLRLVTWFYMQLSYRRFVKPKVTQLAERIRRHRTWPSPGIRAAGDKAAAELDTTRLQERREMVP